MDKIIEPISRNILIEELSKCKLIRRTSRKGNEIYSFSHRDAPYLMLEVARLREESFRAIGCGTGKMVDLDDHDIDPGAYNQLIVWDPNDLEIIGGYRYALGKEYIQQTQLLSMAHYFKFSKKFIKTFLPQSIELGRAWVNPLYQPSGNDKRSIFALDNLWEGIGAILSEHGNVDYLFGKVTISKRYNSFARELLLWFLDHYFNKNIDLMSPNSAVSLSKIVDLSGVHVTGNNMEEDLKIISIYIKSVGEVIPPLIGAYLRLAKDLVTFGTTLNREMGNAYETGILIAVKDIHPEKYKRYIEPNKVNQLLLESLV